MNDCGLRMRSPYNATETVVEATHASPEHGTAVGATHAEPEHGTVPGAMNASPEHATLDQRGDTR